MFDFTSDSINEFTERKKSVFLLSFGSYFSSLYWYRFFNNLWDSTISYEELKSNSSFAPWLPTGTPRVKVGTYYLTYPEFDEYKKKNQNKKFVKKV